MIEGGPLVDVDPGRPYPFQTDIRAGATHIVAHGAITRPFDLGVFQASGRITGDDMADLYQLTGVATPNSPPYDVTGDLSRNGDVTDIDRHRRPRRARPTSPATCASATKAGDRRDLTGDLSSRRLKLADLTPP